MIISEIKNPEIFNKFSKFRIILNNLLNLQTVDENKLFFWGGRKKSIRLRFNPI